jgi:hypothetical protein
MLATVVVNRLLTMREAHVLIACCVLSPSLGAGWSTTPTTLIRNARGLQAARREVSQKAPREDVTAAPDIKVSVTIAGTDIMSAPAVSCWGWPELSAFFELRATPAWR